MPRPERSPALPCRRHPRSPCRSCRRPRRRSADLGVRRLVHGRGDLVAHRVDLRADLGRVPTVLRLLTAALAQRLIEWPSDRIRVFTSRHASLTPLSSRAVDSGAASASLVGGSTTGSADESAMTRPRERAAPGRRRWCSGSHRSLRPPVEVVCASTYPHMTRRRRGDDAFVKGGLIGRDSAMQRRRPRRRAGTPHDLRVELRAGVLHDSRIAASCAATRGTGGPRSSR